jgi:hypothetical protein
MSRDVIRQVTVIIAVIATLVMNGLVNALPLNGQTSAEVSDKFQVYFVPAGYVFSIWGVIYLGLILYAIYQALPAQRENPRLRATGYLFALSCLANISWLALWHYERFPLTLVVMGALLFLLIVIYRRLGFGVVRVSAAERWLVQLPFSIYLGWVSVATIANVTVVLDSLNWGGWGISPEIWTIIMLLVGIGLAFGMAFTHGDVAYGLVLIWAYVGIAVKQQDTPTVATAAWIAVGLVFMAVASGVYLRRRTEQQPPAEAQTVI